MGKTFFTGTLARGADDIPRAHAGAGARNGE
jgi:hypothetical protein